MISEKIQACEFSGQDEKNIEKYLVELELNINSCGWGNKKDIKEDAYIWDEINQVKKVDNEGDFKKHKELLIYYISIMLKEDWDRSKNEVNGYSQAFVEILTMILINSAICCLYLHIGQYPPYTWITVVGKVSIYTLMVYGIIKLIIFVADLIRISLGEKFIVHSFLKVLTVELVILIGLFEIPILLNGYLQIVVPGEPLLNSLVSILSYIEAIKIFWNWVIKYEKYRKFCVKIYTSRQKILNETETNLLLYKTNMEEMYQYIKNNQTDVDNVKTTVSSLKKLFKTYKKEIKACLKIESNKTMTAERRNKIDQLKNDLNQLEEYEQKIYKYYNVGLNVKIKSLPGMVGKKWKKIKMRFKRIVGFVERFLNIINTPQILQRGELKNTEKTVYKYIDHLIFNEQQLCKELEQLVKDNIWIEYFLQNPMYQKENWIDFENEISKVIQSLDQDMFFKDGEKSELSEKMQNLSNPFLHKKYSKYTAAMRTASALTHGKGESITYKEIRDRLYNDLNKLIRALEIYLTDYVEKEECNCVLPDIQEIVKENVKGADGEEQIKYCKVLSFNYTNTYERLYLDKQQIQNSIDYIHGKAKLFNTVENNNMVLGIDEYLTDERKDRETEFIAFKKFYQRIYKETGCKYKDWVETIREEYDDFLQEKERIINRANEYVGNDVQRMMHRLQASAVRDQKCKMHNVYIFGHSLDITDKDILRELILNENVYTTIFYLNRDVMGQQIANLVKIIGQDELIRRTGGKSKTIEFKQQKEC